MNQWDEIVLRMAPVTMEEIHGLFSFAFLSILYTKHSLKLEASCKSLPVM